MSDPNAIALWEETGMERGKALSIMLGRIQQERRDTYGAENARKVMQAIMDTME